MKGIILLLLIIASTANVFGNNGDVHPVDIAKAIKMGMIDYEMTGAWKSTGMVREDARGIYFGQCMAIKIFNQTDTVVEITIDNGLMLMSEYKEVQDMVVTKAEDIVISPKRNRTIILYAMCTEIHDKVPHTEVNYTIGKMAKPSLVKITRTIEKMLMNNISGQGAVWACTDNATEQDLRYYYATDQTLKKTVDVLNKAGVETKLNATEHHDAKQDASDTVTATVADVPTGNNTTTKAPKPETGSAINAYLVYGGAAVTGVTLAGLFFVFFRRKKEDKSNVA